MKRNRGLLIAVGALLSVGALVGTVGIANAQSNFGSKVTVRTGKTVPVPTLNNGESASFRVIDDGKSLLILGNGRGMAGAKSYVSLIYTDDKCSKNVGLAGLTIDGAWQDHGDAKQTLYARYDNKSYAAVKNGAVKSVSVREITAVDLTNNAAATATLTPRACATLK